MFDQYVKTRAEEERKERKNKLMQAKDDFRRMMEDAKLNTRSLDLDVRYLKVTRVCSPIYFTPIYI